MTDKTMSIVRLAGPALIVIISLLLLPLFAESPRITSETVLAEFDGGIITKADFDEEFYKLPEMFRANYAIRQNRADFLRAIVINRITYKEALSEGLDRDPETFADFEHKLKPYFAGLYRRSEISERAQYTEEELKSYYENNLSGFRVRSNTVIKHIQSDSRSVRAVRRALRRSQDFEEIVAEHSINDFSKRNNGIIGNIRGTGLIPGIGFDNKLNDAVNQAELNEWNGPIDTETGTHFFKVIERVEPRTRPFEEVREDIAYLKTLRAEQRIKQEHTRELKDKHNVEINHEKLDSINLLALTDWDDVLDEVVITGDIPGMEITVGDLYEHFKTVSPYIVNDDLTSNLSYYDLVRYLSRDEWIELTKPKALIRLVNNIVEVNLYDFEARQDVYEEIDTDDPEMLFLAGDPTSSRYDEEVFQHPEVKQLRRHVILQSYFRQAVTDQVDPSPEEVKQYYKDNIGIFTTRDNRVVRLFLFETEREVRRAKRQYQDILAMDDENIQQEAIRELILSSLFTHREGIIPYIYKGHDVPIFGDDNVMYDIFWETPIGEVSDIHQNEAGLWFFIDALDFFPAHEYPFTHLENWITNSLTYTRRRDRWLEVKEELMEKYNVVLYPERLFIVMDADELFALAEDAQMRRRYQDALDYYTQIIEYHQNGEDDYRALFMKAFIMAQELGKHQEAVSLFRSVIDDYPESNLHDSAKYMLDELLE